MNTNNFGIMQLVIKYHKTLLLVVVLSASTAILFSSPAFLTPLFKSTVIMYPASSNSISRSLLNENTSGRNDILEFGEEEQAFQMLQILNSNKIRDRVISKYRLLAHYKIDEDAKYAKTKLYHQYDSKVSFSQTKYNAVEITVLDKNPNVAANIANEIAFLFDSVKNNMQQERALRGLQIIETEFLSKKSEVKSMEDSLTQLRILGIHDYESQAEMMNQQLAMEISKGNKEGIRALEGKLNLLAKYGGYYVSIRDELEYEKKQLSYLKARYNEAKIDATGEIPQKFIIENAYASDRKAFPRRGLIVMLCTLAALCASMVVIFFYAQHEVPKQKITPILKRVPERKINGEEKFKLKKSRISAMSVH